jgi:hypothetical protein
VYLHHLKKYRTLLKDGTKGYLMSQYVTALDPLLQEQGVSEEGKKLARGLIHWQHCPQNATHFYWVGRRIYFLDQGARDDFLRLLQISENDQCIPPGDAERIWAAFMSLEKQVQGESSPRISRPALQILLEAAFEKVRMRI